MFIDNCQTFVVEIMILILLQGCLYECTFGKYSFYPTIKHVLSSTQTGQFNTDIYVCSQISTESCINTWVYFVRNLLVW